MRRVLGACICTLVGLVPLAANAAPVSFGPIPYLSSADTPADFFSQLCALQIEDFEPDSGGSYSPNGFLTLGPGERIGPDFMSGSEGVSVDSVDGDDSLGIDGDGSKSWAWYSGSTRSITVAFGAPVTSAGFVLTDGDKAATNVIVEVFGSTGSMTTVVDAGFLDNSYNGETAEDRFIGFRDPDGITSLTISINAGLGIEIDHIQWQNCAVPEPSSMGLGLLGLASLLGLRRRRR